MQAWALHNPMHILNSGIWFRMRTANRSLIFQQIKIFTAENIESVKIYKLLFYLHFTDLNVFF